MKNYRIRAFVDGQPEERIIQGQNHEHAMQIFSKIDDNLPISLAMIHRISFEENGPKFHDVTSDMSERWDLCSYEEACSFYRIEENKSEVDRPRESQS